MASPPVKPVKIAIGDGGELEAILPNRYQTLTGI